MALPIEFQNELERWLTRALDERFARQQRAVLEGVIRMVGAMLNEQIKLGGEACKLGFEEEFAKLQDAVDRQQSAVAQLQGLIEQLQRLDRAAHGEPIDSTKMN